MVQMEHGELSRSEREDRFYHLLAGAAGVRLLESVIELKLPELLAQKGGLLAADEAIALLALHPERGRKWLLVLRYVGLLEEVPRHDGQPVRYRAGPLMRALFHEDGTMGYFYKDFLRYFRKVQEFDLVKVLRGQPVPQVPYPPRELEDVEFLESWMRETAKETIETIERTVTFNDVTHLLDVGGGDATMAATLVRRYPQLHVTVFNLPSSAFLARQNIARAGVTDRVRVVEGDFRRDSLPQGYDMVMLSRVLADWPADVCQKLLRQAHESLVSHGRMLICEPMTDDNSDLTVTWEFTYIPYDDFGIGCYKSMATYKHLLAETGFTVLKIANRSKDTIHSVILAQRL